MSFGGSAISKELYDWIRGNLSSGTILEMGSGRGTKELLKSYTVYSIEHSEKWLNFAKGSNYIYAPLKQYSGYQWYDIDKLKNLPKYDLILVDGPKELTGRWGFYKNIHLFNTAVPIIIDDTQRPQEKLLAEVIAFEFGKKLTEHKSPDKKFTTLE